MSVLDWFRFVFVCLFVCFVVPSLVVSVLRGARVELESATHLRIADVLLRLYASGFT